ncbi:MAG TPA: fluoride efflux transporter CrcB [Azospirillaceae bacterium]|nr:fluoride efflux transporter CrcB [Azospirillaceae bacterium]
MGTALAVAAGGASGALVRWWMAAWVARMVGSQFPFGTLAVNVVGGLAMGVVTALAGHIWQMPPILRTFLTVGVLGGFTTFSAFSLEMASMLERGQTVAAMAYAIASVALSVLALQAGMAVVRNLPA